MPPPAPPKKLPNFFARKLFCGFGGAGLLSVWVDCCLDSEGEAIGVSGRDAAPPGKTVRNELLYSL